MRIGAQINHDDQQNRNYIKFNTDDKEKFHEAMPFATGGWDFTVEEEQRLKGSLLKKFFDTHRQFYNYIDFEAGKEHGLQGETFSTPGFQQFLQDFTGENIRYMRYIEDEEKLQILCDALTQRAADLIEDHNDELVEDEETMVAKSTVTIESEPPEKLRDPEMLDESLILGDDSVHKVSIRELQDAQNLEDVKQEVKDAIKGVYETQVETKEETLKNRINNLEEQIEEERQEMLIKGLELVDKLDDWKVEDGHLVYQKTLVPQVATKTRDNGENPKPLTQEAKEKFYIEGVKVPIKKTINRPKYEEAYHPHALGTVCTGGFGMELSKEGLDKVIEQLQQINLHDHDNNDAETDFRENFDKYTKDEEDAEVWTA